MAKKNKRKDIVYSTNPDFEYETESHDDEETLNPGDQLLYVELDRKQRKGKTVTLITNFVGTEEDLIDLGKTLKSKCGTGGSAKDGEIIIQGEKREQVMELLEEMGYQTKRKGG